MKHPDCEEKCQIAEHKGYHSCESDCQAAQLMTLDMVVDLTPSYSEARKELMKLRTDLAKSQDVEQRCRNAAEICGVHWTGGDPGMSLKDEIVALREKLATASAPA